MLSKPGWIDRVIETHGPGATALVRVLVGWVFLAEGLQKVLFPAALGVGRFAKIGIPWPRFSAPFDAAFEIGCGILMLFGLFTRASAIPLIIDISVAIVSTKIPVWAHTGFWSMAHEARTDFSMLFGLVFLLIEGGGKWSADARWARRRGVDG